MKKYLKTFDVNGQRKSRPLMAKPMKRNRTSRLPKHARKSRPLFNKDPPARSLRHYCNVEAPWSPWQPAGLSLIVTGPLTQCFPLSSAVSALLRGKPVCVLCSSSSSSPPPAAGGGP